MHTTYTPYSEAQILVRFALWGVIFELCFFFRKGAMNDPKWPWHVQGQKYQYACYVIHPEAQMLLGFADRWPTFELRPFLLKCTEWPQMTLTCLRSKIPICVLHTPPKPKLSSVSMSRFRVAAQFCEKCIEWPQNCLDIFKVIYICMLHIFQRSKFSSLLLYDDVFEENEIF